MCVFVTEVNGSSGGRCFCCAFPRAVRALITRGLARLCCVFEVSSLTVCHSCEGAVFFLLVGNTEFLNLPLIFVSLPAFHTLR